MENLTLISSGSRYVYILDHVNVYSRENVNVYNWNSLEIFNCLCCPWWFAVFDFQDSILLVESSRFTFVYDDRECSLVVLNAQPEDVGVYTCTAQNMAGSVSCKAELTVHTGKLYKLVWIWLAWPKAVLVLILILI